jgi:Ca2+-transporting ATPase
VLPSAANLGSPSLLVVHANVPGRLRVRVRELYRNPELEERLERELERVPGVGSVQASTVTATVLVQGDQGAAVPALRRLAELIGARLDDTVAVAAPPVDSRGPRKETIERVARWLRAGPASIEEGIGRLSSALRNREEEEGEGAGPASAAGRRRPVAAPEGRPFHAWGADELLAYLGSSRAGLSANEALRRREREGANVLKEAPRRSELAIFAGQLTSLPVALLAGSAVLSVMTGGLGDAIVILVVVGVNATLGYVTESRAEKIIRSLEQTTQLPTRVLRDGNAAHIPVDEVTVGDVLVLGPGSFVAADCRILSSDMLLVDESALTGESVPVQKSEATLADPLLPLADRTDMAFRGTLVTGGSGLALVVAIGDDTEIGTIQALASEVEQRATPLEQQLEHLGVELVIISGAACGAVFVIGLLRGYPLLEMLKVSISLAVAAVPEGLPTVASTTLALGIRRMQELDVYVRRLEAVETLGAIQTLCLDKTGTITVNRMTVVALAAGFRAAEVEGGRVRRDGADVDVPGDLDLRKLLDVMCLCNETEVTIEGGALVLEGSSTEAALVRVSADAGIDVLGLRRRYPLLATRYRSETRSFMATLHEAGERKLLAVKGRASEVLAMCAHRLEEGSVVPLSDADRAEIAAREDQMASRALRVLGAAYVEGGDVPLELETGLVWVGLVGMSDPPRAGLSELMHRFHTAGIDTVMITGDQSATAYAIGREIGLARDGHMEVLDSSALEQIDKTVLAAMAPRAQIFSRVSPAHKLSIVHALQRGGRVVAMTGDGINDSPALKAADVGVAMGAGTAAAREMADVVLRRDDLSAMVTAIEQGRTVYDDIKKAVHMIISTNSNEILLTLASVIAGLGQTLTPMQLLWLNVITDIFPELALAVQPPDSDVLRRPPRDPRRPMFERSEFLRMGREGTVLTLASAAAVYYGRSRYGAGLRASSVTLTSMISAHMLHTIVCRSDRHSVFDGRELPRNGKIPLALGTSLGLHLLATLVPGTRRLLTLALPSPTDLAVCFSCGGAAFLVNELLKNVQRIGEEQPPEEPAIRAA